MHMFYIQILVKHDQYDVLKPVRYNSNDYKKELDENQKIYNL
jgi:hypothetical protein